MRLRKKFYVSWQKTKISIQCTLIQLCTSLQGYVTIFSLLLQRYKCLLVVSAFILLFSPRMVATCGWTFFYHVALHYLSVFVFSSKTVISFGNMSICDVLCWGRFVYFQLYFLSGRRLTRVTLLNFAVPAISRLWAGHENSKWHVFNF